MNEWEKEPYNSSTKISPFVDYKNKINASNLVTRCKDTKDTQQ